MLVMGLFFSMDVDNDNSCAEKGVDKADDPRISYFSYFSVLISPSLLTAQQLSCGKERERYNLGTAISVNLERLYHETSKYNSTV